MQVLANLDLVLVKGLILCLRILVIIILHSTLAVKHFMLVVVLEVDKAALVLIEIAQII
jgi:hypothetical protein